MVRHCTRCLMRGCAGIVRIGLGVCACVRNTCSTISIRMRSLTCTSLQVLGFPSASDGAYWKRLGESTGEDEFYFFLKTSLPVRSSAFDLARVCVHAYPACENPAASSAGVKIRQRHRHNFCLYTRTHVRSCSARARLNRFTMRSDSVRRSIVATSIAVRQT